MNLQSRHFERFHFIRKLILPFAFGILQSTEAATFLKLVSSPGDYIGGGVTRTITDADATFTSSCSQNAALVYLNGSGNWRVEIASPDGSPLIAEVYEKATRYPFQSPTRPGLDVGGNGAGCNESFGRFVVREIACSVTNNVEKLAVDFEQHCESASAPPLLGYLRFNSTIPETVPQPTASAGIDQSVEEGQVVTLDGSLSKAPQGISSVSWQQVSGPTVTLSSSTTLTTSLTAPEVAPGGAVIVMQLTVTGTNGLTDSNSVNIAIRDRDDPRSFLTLVSHPGDFVGSGVTRTIAELDATFSGTCTASVAGVYVIGGSPWWGIDIASPQGSNLTPGSYEQATRYPFQNAAAPGLDVSGDGGCNELSGRFVLHELTCGGDGKVQKLAVDFEQHCEVATAPPLFGFLRFNSPVAVPTVFDRGCRLDIDGDGALNKARDGGLLLRSLAGFRGAALEGADQSPGATRRYDFQLNPYINTTCARISPDVGPPYCSLDLDGDGQIGLATDGVIATRLLAGFRDDSVLANVLGTNATRTSWTQLDAYLHTCSLLPN